MLADFSLTPEVARRSKGRSGKTGRHNLPTFACARQPHSASYSDVPHFTAAPCDRTLRKAASREKTPLREPKGSRLRPVVFYDQWIVSAMDPNRFSTNSHLCQPLPSHTLCFPFPRFLPRSLFSALLTVPELLFLGSSGLTFAHNLRSCLSGSFSSKLVGTRTDVCVHLRACASSALLSALALLSLLSLPCAWLHSPCCLLRFSVDAKPVVAQLLQDIYFEVCTIFAWTSSSNRPRPDGDTYVCFNTHTRPRRPRLSQLLLTLPIP